VIEYVPSSPIVVLPISFPFSSVNTTVLPASPVPVIVGVLSFVILSLLLTPVSDSAAKSIEALSTVVSLVIVSVEVV